MWDLTLERKIIHQAKITLSCQMRIQDVLFGKLQCYLENSWQMIRRGHWVSHSFCDPVLENCQPKKKRIAVKGCYSLAIRSWLRLCLPNEPYISLLTLRCILTTKLKYNRLFLLCSLNFIKNFYNTFYAFIYVVEDCKILESYTKVCWCHNFSLMLQIHYEII